MKKLVLTTVCALAVAGSAFAQGNINFTLSPANATALTNSTAYSPLFGGGTTGGGASGKTAAGVGGTFVYELLYSSTFTGVQLAGASAPSNNFAVLFGGTWQDTGLKATNATGVGQIAGNPANVGAQVPWSPGTTDNIVLVGWSINLGSTWSAVSNTLATQSYGIGNFFFGVSATGFVTPQTTSTSPGSTVFGTAATAAGLPINALNMQLFLLPPVPEPSTMALAGIGGLAVLLFRRRK
jgi:hypothetical protein